jgi:hypothetical protein
MKIHLLLLFSVCFCLPTRGDEAAPAPQVQRLRTWQVPPDLIPRPANGSTAQWDVREWLEANGAKFAPGDEAICNSSGNLIVRAKAETLDLVDQALTFGTRLTAESNLRVEVVLAEFSAAKVPELDGEIPYATLRKAAGDSWHVLNHIIVVTTSGQRAVVTSSEGTPEKKKTEPLPEQGQPQSSNGSGPVLRLGESGATLMLDPVLNENGKTIDVNVDYHYRGTGAWDWKGTLPITVKDGVPMLAQLDSVQSRGDRAQPANLRALVLRVDVVHPQKTTTRPNREPASSQPPTAPSH